MSEANINIDGKEVINFFTKPKDPLETALWDIRMSVLIGVGAVFATVGVALVAALLVIVSATIIFIYHTTSYCACMVSYLQVLQ